MLLGILGHIFLGNLVTGIGAIGTSQGGVTIKPGKGTIRAGENFKCRPIL